MNPFWFRHYLLYEEVSYDDHLNALMRFKNPWELYSRELIDRLRYHGADRKSIRYL